MPRTTKPLTKEDVQKAKLPAGKSALKLTDGRGLHMLVRASKAGAPLKSWHFDFTIDGKRKVVVVGRFPEMTLTDARHEAERLRALVRSGVDPSKPTAVDETSAPPVVTFNRAADEWAAAQRLKVARGELTSDTCDKVEWQIGLLRAEFGEMPITDVRPAHVLSALQQIEARGLIDTARRARAVASRIFAYATIKDYCQFDPAASLGKSGVLATVQKEHFAAITDPVAFGGLLRAIADYPQPQTSLALQLLARVALRQGELRQLRWDWITDDEIRIPAGFMKMRQDHAVPMSRQVRDILDKLRSMRVGDCELVFPSPRDRKRPISEATLNAALARLGYTSDIHVPHGFRTSFSTLANDSLAFSPDVVEAALAHNGRGIRAIYNRTTYQQERVRLVQWWSDECDRLMRLKSHT